MSIFQSSMKSCKNIIGEKINYNTQLFFCPVVYAKDGFKLSLQIHNGNYCSSENGYRELGHTWEEVEFGFPSEDDRLLHQYSEGYDWHEDDPQVPFNSVGRVGRIPVSVLNELFEKRGGIDWEKTISIEAFWKMTK
jgi:hypothetical protein